MKTSHTMNRRVAGFTLIELMISLALGLLVVAAAGALFASNRRVYGTTETVNRIQENSRAAFEIMARDIRAAGSSPCGAAMTSFESVLNNRNSNTIWAEFTQAVRGGSNAYGDVLRLYNGASFSNDVYITRHENPAAVLDVTSTSEIADGDILIACNAAKGFIFQATHLTGNELKVGHNSGGSEEPGNCGKNFGPNCSNGNNDPLAYCFSFGRTCQRGMPSEPPPPAQIVKASGVEWSIRDNGRNGTSLYRRIIPMGTNAAPGPNDGTLQEIVEGVTGMALTYQQNAGGAFVTRTNVTDWSLVRAVNVNLTFAAVEGIQRGEDLRGTGATALSRTMNSVVTIRNREGVL